MKRAYVACAFFFFFSQWFGIDRGYGAMKRCYRGGASSGIVVRSFGRSKYDGFDMQLIIQERYDDILL